MYDVSSYQVTGSEEQVLESLMLEIERIGKVGNGYTTVIGIFAIVCLWFIFKKAGKPGWAAIIPIYNVVVYFQICGINPLVLLWLFLPVIGWIIFLVYDIKALFNLAKAFGKSTGFGFGLLFLEPIFMAILAFDKKSTYVGVPSK